MCRVCGCFSFLRIFENLVLCYFYHDSSPEYFVIGRSGRCGSLNSKKVKFCIVHRGHYVDFYFFLLFGIRIAAAAAGSISGSLS